MSCIEICAGAGGQALGLERAGFSHTALVELDRDATQTLRLNRPDWNITQSDIRRIRAGDLIAPGDTVRLLAAGCRARPSPWPAGNWDPRMNAISSPTCSGLPLSFARVR